MAGGCGCVVVFEEAHRLKDGPGVCFELLQPRLAAGHLQVDDQVGRRDARDEVAPHPAIPGPVQEVLPEASDRLPGAVALIVRPNRLCRSRRRRGASVTVLAWGS